MKTAIPISLIALLQFICSNGIMNPVEAEESLTMGSLCLDSQYHAYTFVAPTHIPDNDSKGVVLGPIKLNDNDCPLQGIVLEMDIQHEYLGDLTFTFAYDVDDDGIFEASTPIDFHLARLDPCSGRELNACPAEIDGFYYFKDEGWKESGEDCSFAVLDKLPSGGSFYLAIADRLEDNTGDIRSWTVYIPDPGENIMDGRYVTR